MRYIKCDKKKEHTLITVKRDANREKETYLKAPIYILQAYSLVQSYVQEVSCYFYSPSVNLTIFLKENNFKSTSKYMQ